MKINKNFKLLKIAMCLASVGGMTNKNTGFSMMQNHNNVYNIAGRYALSPTERNRFNELNVITANDKAKQCLRNVSNFVNYSGNLNEELKQYKQFEEHVQHLVGIVNAYRQR